MRKWIVFTPEQNTAALENNSTDYQVVPRLIDNPDHAEAGNYVAPVRVAGGPQYGPVWNEMLSDHRRIFAAAEDLFLPDDDML